jgi:hypothetical protein
LENLSNQNIEDLDVSVRGSTSGDVRIISSTCDVLFHGCNACLVRIGVKPTALDDDSFLRQVGLIATDGNGNVASIGLNYEVTRQRASFDAAHEYGNVALSSSASHTFTLTNDSSTSLNDLEIDIVDLDELPISEYQIGDTTCGSSLDPEETCEIEVIFSSSTAGSFPGWLRATCDGGETIRKVHAWAGQANVAFTETSYDFGELSLESTGSHELTLQNTSGIAATGLQVLAPHASEDFEIVSSTCGTSLAANSSCTIEIEFNPLVPTSSFHQLTVKYGAERLAFSDLSGSGEAGALNFINAWEDLGRTTIGNSAVMTVTLANTSENEVTSLSLSLADDGDGQLSLENNTCPSSLDAEETCTVDVRFTSATEGFADGLLVARGASDEYGAVYLVTEAVAPEPTPTPTPTPLPTEVEE